jgi:mRNA-degrading endonuclease RelE of RelBE toxin-antitoxin system
MNWVVRIAEDARLFVDSLPEKLRRQVVRSINQLETDPFRGDVQPLQGREWLGYYRKRAGDYRIIFLIHRRERLVDVAHVLLRSEKTYR